MEGQANSDAINHTPAAVSTMRAAGQRMATIALAAMTIPTTKALMNVGRLCGHRKAEANSHTPSTTLTEPVSCLIASPHEGPLWFRIQTGHLAPGAPSAAARVVGLWRATVALVGCGEARRLQGEANGCGSVSA